MIEDDFLQDLFRKLPPAPNDLIVPVGDDCAALRISDNRLLLLAVDQVVGDRHFVMSETSPEAAGKKLLARNVSDIGAMGGVPAHCLVATASDADSAASWLGRFLDSIISWSRTWGIALVGGDLAGTPHDFVASLTITGYVDENKVCRRSGAQCSDCLFATGKFGSSLASGHHLHFTPRHLEGKWLADHMFAKAMIDVSDGLLLDAERLCRASGLGLQLEPEKIPRRTPQTSLQAALSDGEDYELLFAVAPDKVALLQQQWPFSNLQLNCIGRFVASEPGLIVSEEGRILNSGKKGFDHFNLRTEE